MRPSLEVQRSGTVDEEWGTLPLHHVHFPNPVRLEGGHELRECHVVAGERIDTVERDPTGDPVVAVGGSEEVRAVWVLADDEIGAPLADHPRDVAPQVARVLDLAVRVAE